MNQRWTLHIENFARIESADIEISPLMCFIGDNNSGKSYVMSLLWGIMSNEEFFFGSLHTELESYANCKEFILSHVDKGVMLNDKVSRMYLEFFNDLLSSCKDELVQKIFNHAIPIGKIEIINFTFSEKLPLRIKRSEKKARISFEHRLVRDLNLLESDVGEQADRNYMGISLPVSDEYLEVALWRANIGIVFNLIMMDWLFVDSTITFASPIYLPASRTGFLMTYSQIASNSVRSFFSADSDIRSWQSTLTLPYIQFLQLLIELKDSATSDVETHKDLINFIRSEILHGTIRVKNDGKLVRYQASDMREELPLSVTSSVVTEIASLLLLLTTKIPLRLVIIEEPEAHLHPALQKKIAQLLVRFVHSGVPIWITTHSDTILHHFNNMLNLNALADGDKERLLEEFNYTKKDLLTPAEINLYQFERGLSHTTITKLVAGKYGFKATSFNEAIDSLAREIFSFQEDE